MADKYQAAIEAAKQKFEEILREQLARTEKIKDRAGAVDFAKLDKIIVGICGGDGIGPTITAAARKVLEHLLADEISAGRIELRGIEGLTIENRAAHGSYTGRRDGRAYKCHVIWKGPTTPRARPGQTSSQERDAQSDLCANVRPVRCRTRASTDISANTEGSYAVGSQNIRDGRPCGGFHHHDDAGPSGWQAGV